MRNANSTLPIHSQPLTPPTQRATLYLYVSEVVQNVLLPTYKPSLKRNTNRFVSLASRFVTNHLQPKITKHKSHASACTNTQTTISNNERV